MSKRILASVTADEAIARIVNIDYIPEGFSLLEMTAAFLEDAEIDYENARMDHLPDDQKSELAIRANVCENRHLLAQQLLEALALELARPKNSIIVIPCKSSTVQHFSMASITAWTFDKFGIGMPSWHKAEAYTKATGVVASWEDVTIKIYKEYHLGVKVGGGNYRRKSFQKLGLMGIKKNMPNVIGGVLVGFSQDKKYPNSSTPDPKHKTLISKLRKLLVDVTGITSDPFAPFNPADGWRPRFELIDDRKNADNRAKKKALRSKYSRDPNKVGILGDRDR